MAEPPFRLHAREQEAQIIYRVYLKLTEVIFCPQCRRKNPAPPFMAAEDLGFLAGRFIHRRLDLIRL
jgi:hypothetical protein